MTPKSVSTSPSSVSKLCSFLPINKTSQTAYRLFTIRRTSHSSLCIKNRTPTCTLFFCCLPPAPRRCPSQRAWPSAWRPWTSSSTTTSARACRGCSPGSGFARSQLRLEGGGGGGGGSPPSTPGLQDMSCLLKLTPKV